MAANQDQATETPWWASFPEVQSECPRLEPEEVKLLLDDGPAAKGKDGKRDFLLVDVRRTDWEGGTVATSINFPAHTLYQTRPVIYQLCKQAGIKKIIFYCGSSNGRGPRSAGWMQDYLNEVGETQIKSLVLKGGIKGWQKKYGGGLMDWYDEKFWASQ
ncbi:unnamed protein product [Clonostachys byssicola]|uniref:Rhodanese domain-containing protein n=1 Tax=Clonostachys byssicola TaxID=160290 RepID=A0A9N9UJN0_9HYPO|nr:unnamed protein product [Clonostachys byssicola]